MAELTKPRVLFICYDFPPLNTGGSRRAFRFCKELMKNGFDPMVIAPELNDNYAKKIDATLANELHDSGIVVVRTAMTKRTRYWNQIGHKLIFNLVDDIYRRWKKTLLKELRNQVSIQNISCAFISVPPFSLTALDKHLIQLKIPYILDFRDAWSQWVIAPYFTRINYKLIFHRERKVLEKANSILVVSYQMKSDFSKLHPIRSDKIKVITNSFEDTLSEYPREFVFKKNQHIKIVYVGSFYYNEKSHHLIMKRWWQKAPHQIFQYIPKRENWFYRTPYFFFQALHSLFEANPEYKSRIRVEFAGKIPSWLPQQISEFQLEENVKLFGFLDAQKSLELQKSADMLLITSMKVVNGRDYCIAGKTFEYIQAKKPILGFVTEGSQKDFLKRIGSGIICDPDDVLGSTRRLKRVFDGKIALKPDKKFIDSLSSQHTGMLLSDVIKKFLKPIKSIVNE
ncbi:glycosyltransferase [Ekhidna sp.]|uniref:glycosyltransferase n=1 Tax=Ekhidna sp. TaxID=2608089 RepID=UPI003B514276